MSHVLRVGVADQIAYFRAYNTDGSANTSLTASTTGLTLSVFRVGASSVSIASLSNKAADNTAHADGAIRNVGGNLYTIDLPDAACATQVPSICVRGSYTGGVIEGLEHPIVAYDPSVVAVGANTTIPPTAAANATAVRSELGLTGTLDSAFDAIPTAEENGAAGWDALQVDHTSTGSFGAGVGYIITTVAAILVAVNTLTSRISSGVATMFADLIQMITASTTANAQWTAKALENVVSASGSGARSVSITVLLDEIAQQSALVRLVKGAEKYLATTDEDGLAEFSVNDGTWRVSITLANTQFTPVDLVVNANVSQSYSLTALPALEASDPNKITGYWLCLSQAGTPESGVQITLTAMSLPPNSTGLILDSASRSATTGADGIASFTNLIPGVRYKVKRNSGREFYFVCPDYQSDPVDLASFIGT